MERPCHQIRNRLRVLVTLPSQGVDDLLPPFPSMVLAQLPLPLDTSDLDPKGHDGLRKPIEEFVAVAKPPWLGHRLLVQQNEISQGLQGSIAILDKVK